MAGEIFRPARHAVAGEVGRRRHQQRTAAGEPPRDESGIGLGGDPDRQVDALAYQIDRRVTDLEGHRQARMRGQEIGNGRRQVRLTEGGCTRDAQLATQVACLLRDIGLEFVGQLEHLAAAAQTLLASVGQGQAPRRAVHQTHVEPLLQRGDMAGDHGPRQVEAFGRSAEAAPLGDLGKHPHGHQSIHQFVRFVQQTRHILAVYPTFIRT